MQLSGVMELLCLMERNAPADCSDQNPTPFLQNIAVFILWNKLIVLIEMVDEQILIKNNPINGFERRLSW